MKLRDRTPHQHTNGGIPQTFRYSNGYYLPQSPLVTRMVKDTVLYIIIKNN